MTRPAAIVFTDLDGTLLDHLTYRHEAAIPALNLLVKNNIPVILASSKTAAEIAPLRKALGLAAYPAIVENGAGVLSPHADSVANPDNDYLRIRRTLESIPDDLRLYFKGFGDMSKAEIASSTGLPESAAALARTRSFSEPGHWSGDDQTLATFLDRLATQGITARHGGRYLTLSFGKTKADQITSICNLYGNPPVIALGDAPNDLEMLRMADYPILIRNPHATPLTGLSPTDHARILHSTLIGPEGWNEMVPPIVHTLIAPRKGA